MDPQSLLQVTLASFFPPWYRNKRIWSCTQGTSLRQHPICVQNASMPCFDCVRNGHVARFCKMLLNNRLGIRVARWKQLLVSMHTHTIFQRRLWRVNEHCCKNHTFTNCLFDQFVSQWYLNFQQTHRPIFFRHCHYWQFLFPRTFRSWKTITNSAKHSPVYQRSPRLFSQWSLRQQCHQSGLVELPVVR